MAVGIETATGPVPPPAARRRVGTWRDDVPLMTCALGLLVVGVGLRLPVLSYHALATQRAINVYLFDHVGAYSDVVSLYFRDRLWAHPAPYFDYPLEYPVLLGGFVWLVGFVHSGAGAYFLASAGALVGCGVAAVWLIRRLRGANAWLFAAAPALAFYGVLNWDLFGLCLFAGALVLYQRRRDGWAGAVLALAVWAKFFPLVVLPVLLVARAAERRWRSALGLAAAFVGVTVAVNAPAALERGALHLVVLRPGWTYFFTFTRHRPSSWTFWAKAGVSIDTANLATGLLLVAGVGAIAALVARRARRGNDVAIPASAAALLWLFAISKVYSPQYALWIFAAMAIADVPLAVAAGFALIDAVIFSADFGTFHHGAGLTGLAWAGNYARQVTTAALAGLVAARLTRHPSSTRVEPAGT